MGFTGPPVAPGTRSGLMVGRNVLHHIAAQDGHSALAHPLAAGGVESGRRDVQVQVRTSMA
jgi:hypothetical protein